MPLTLSSPDFVHGAAIPSRFTCEGADMSPALQWSDPPDGTASFALIVDDPDAPDPARPQRIWVHWVLYNLPASTRELSHAIENERGLPSGALQGLNDWDRKGYGGPCPPIGRHRYFFHLYALDRALSELKPPTRADLDRAMSGHILATAELMGTYEKGKR